MSFWQRAMKALVRGNDVHMLHSCLSSELFIHLRICSAVAESKPGLIKSPTSNLPEGQNETRAIRSQPARVLYKRQVAAD